MHPATKHREVLLVEDNPADVYLLQRCLQRVLIPHHLHVVHDGAAALAFLQRQPPYTTAPIPDLLLMDIYLPSQSGWDLLAWVKTTPTLATRPVIMLTGLLAPLDEEARDRLQPTACIVKPLHVEELHSLTHVLATVLRDLLPTSRDREGAQH
jgi:chemotaxis family two-component system response regulator Rcp1